MHLRFTQDERGKSQRRVVSWAGEERWMRTSDRFSSPMQLVLGVDQAVTHQECHST